MGTVETAEVVEEDGIGDEHAQVAKDRVGKDLTWVRLGKHGFGRIRIGGRKEWFEEAREGHKKVGLEDRLV